MLETALEPIDDDIGDSAAEARANGAESDQRGSRLPMIAFVDYELLEEIGRGGQGVVYRARQKSLKRIVALKVIGLGPWSSTLRLKRFRQEAEAAATLEHPQIVPIYEIGERDGSCYFSMKFVEGGQLDEVLKREPMSPRRAAELLARIARTVQFAHEHGILHRDIKPGNILLDRKGEPHLTDFGLARLLEQDSTITNSSDVLGTPSYMPPEQAAGDTKQLTAAADVYSLGAVFYHMLTGEPPFCGSTSYETIRMVLENEPRNPRARNPKIDTDLATICLKCLEKDPKKRYATAGTLADDIERWLRHEPIHARRAGVLLRGKKWLQRNPAAATAGLSVACLVAAIAVLIWNGNSFRRPLDAGTKVPDKSIAVLPFDNLSEEKANSYFADGVQDQVLTDLSRIADLKVISRTSVMQYKSGTPRNVREIGRQLGVAHVLEGSVQRAGNKIRVSAQLIDARNDSHLWANTYDRDLADVFAIQSEIAKTIADQLKAKLSRSEKSAIEQPPTSDVIAFDFYTRAKNLMFDSASVGYNKARHEQAIEFLKQAIARDPSFFDAYCLLAWWHDNYYLVGFDQTPARLALAEAAIETAAHLRPAAGETHLARAHNLYATLEYDAALRELELARQTLANDPRIFQLMGFIQRRQPGRYEESTRTLERSFDLDPRNPLTLSQTAAYNYRRLARFADAKSAWDRRLAIKPDDLNAKVERASVDVDWKADTRPLRETIESIRAENPAALQTVADRWLFCALAGRDVAAAKDVLKTSASNEFELTDENVYFNRPAVEGIIALMAGDEAAARSAFTAARAEQEKIIQEQPEFGPAYSVLGLIDAGLGRKEDALREARHAIELLPVKKDAPDGADLIKYFAMIAAWVGEKDLAFEKLEIAIHGSSGLTYGELKLMPMWDPLRGDPRLEKILVSLAPREN
jgi:TolB-like protein/Tfp pilus assembly protein PilF/predicted Ser/Thr protein kinase